MANDPLPHKKGETFPLPPDLVSALVNDGVADDVGKDEELAQADGQPQPDVVHLHQSGINS